MGEIDRALDALRKPSRRQLLAELLDENPQYVAQAPGSDVDAAQAELEMVHSHLPKLKDYEYITWERETGTIEKGERWSELEPLLKCVLEHDDRLPAESNVPP